MGKSVECDIRFFLLYHSKNGNRKNFSNFIGIRLVALHPPRTSSASDILIVLPLSKFRSQEELLLYKRYFRWKDADAGSNEWIEMTGKEYYRFATDPQNEGRYFVDLGDVVLECTKAKCKKFKSEDDHSSYILEQETGWITLPLSSIGSQNDLTGEEIIADESENVEDAAILNIRRKALRKAIRLLSDEDYRIISMKYNAINPISEEKIGHILGLSQSGISKRLKDIKKSLKKMVIEFEKSSQ